MFRITYPLVAALARLAVRSGRSKDLEIIVRRHQLAVLRRQVDRPDLDDDDRSLLGAIAPAGHRRRIAAHWTQPQPRRPGRPPTAIDVRL